ncbi:MAG: lipoprotein signal peptidase [Chloroflexi bacterium]|nr:lipoprotein signal peptidase [Chloroflexota bacterium]
MRDAQSDALAPMPQSVVPGAESSDGVRRIATSVVIAAGVLLADQVTKWLAHTYLTRIPDQSIPIIGDFLRLTYVANRGAAFGILQDRTVFFVLIGIAVIVVIIASYRYFKVTGWLLNVALGLQLGGAIGNLIDRVRNGYVVDFIDVAIRPAFSWPVFNVADSAICIGVGILAFHMMRTPKPKPATN